MILDAIENSALIETLNPRFKKAFDYLKNNDLASAPQGVIEIDGKNTYISISEFDGKPDGEARLETHRQYIDIQIPLKGNETIGWKRLASVTEPSGEYNWHDDIRFYEDVPTAQITVTPGEFVIFFPDDAHAPGIASHRIKKAVIKIKI